MNEFGAGRACGVFGLDGGGRIIGRGAYPVGLCCKFCDKAGLDPGWFKAGENGRNPPLCGFAPDGRVGCEVEDPGGLANGRNPEIN